MSNANNQNIISVEDLSPVFRDLDGSSFEFIEDLESEVAEAFHRQLGGFPIFLTYREVIDCARGAGWVSLVEGKFEVRAPDHLLDNSIYAPPPLDDVKVRLQKGWSHKKADGPEAPNRDINSGI